MDGLVVEKQHIIEAVSLSRFKIEWAKVHIGVVERLVAQIISENTDVIRIDNNSNPALVYIGPSQSFPIELPLHIGDAVHNLNSVTDYLWTGLGRASGSKNSGRSSFPRDETRENLKNRVDNPRSADSSIYQSFPQAKSFILDTINPCKRSDNPSLIWHLNKLDNINKHRFIFIIAHLTRFDREFNLIGSDGGRIHFSSAATIQTPGQPMPVGLTPPVKTDRDPKAIVDVVFGEADHFPGNPVIGTLSDLTNSVSHLLKLFEVAFL
jgi:hypothetical protein